MDGMGLRLFFQAGDDIRGLVVTGVQTCALPICYLAAKKNLAMYEAHGDEGGAVGYRIQMERAAKEYISRTRCDPDTGAPIVLTKVQKARSEARRLGKECSTRWSPYH